MRLLNATTIQLEEFAENEIPPYAILSHTWGKTGDEVSFQDIQDRARAEKKPGYRKIKYCCDQAIKDGLKYAWVDTCSIDKSSSAELSEAINSMFRWYECAVKCYVYLADVHADACAQPILDPSNRFKDAFSRSLWFSRGWTLQELLAPRRMIFYTSTWVAIGSKLGLCEDIQKITRIDIEYLRARDGEFRSASVAKRMSWAARRNTTRTEDMAYCLLGIFDIHMPLLYGEGARSFLRLQEEIMKRSDDESLFAWGLQPHISTYNLPWLQVSLPRSQDAGLLAPSPYAFRESGNMVPYQTSSGARKPFGMSNMGLQIELPMARLQSAHWETTDIYFGLLSCKQVDKADLNPGVLLRQMPAQSDRFSRIGGDHLYSLPLLESALSTNLTANLLKRSIFVLSIQQTQTLKQPSKFAQILLQIPPTFDGYFFKGIRPAECAHQGVITIPMIRPSLAPTVNYMIELGNDVNDERRSILLFTKSRDKQLSLKLYSRSSSNPSEWAHFLRFPHRMSSGVSKFETGSHGEAVSLPVENGHITMYLHEDCIVGDTMTYKLSLYEDPDDGRATRQWEKSHGRTQQEQEIFERQEVVEVQISEGVAKRIGDLRSSWKRQRSRAGRHVNPDVKD
jgi:hypothetical protein